MERLQLCVDPVEVKQGAELHEDVEGGAGDGSQGECKSRQEEKFVVDSSRRRDRQLAVNAGH